MGALSNGYHDKLELGENPLVNSWTEFGDLEYVCVGSVLNAHYSDHQITYPYNNVGDKFLSGYIGQAIGPRPPQRIKYATQQLENLVEILEAEHITVGTIQEVDRDIKEDLTRKRGFTNPPKTLKEDKRIKKREVEVCRPSPAKFDHLIQTPYFKNYYQWSNACPRDTLLTIGNTILEAPTPSRVRHYESTYYRDLIYPLWEADKRVQWKTAPKPTCGDIMYNLKHFECTKDEMDSRYAPSGYRTALNETEVAFEAADMLRAGKDIFYKKSSTANNKGLDWMRREFPELRFHMIHIPRRESPHLDANLTLMRPPSSGSDGIVLMNQNFPPLKSEMKIFENNDWRTLWCPLPETSSLSPVATCSSSLNMNLLSLSPNCCIIEECEVQLYHFLEDLGFDVIGVPLRGLNEFGGGVHCVTLDIRRNDTCKDYFPNQDYETECSIDLNNFYDDVTYSK